MQRRQPTSEEVTQKDLRRRWALASQITNLRRQLDEIDESLYVRLKAGARVEEGPHVCEIKTFHRGKKRVERVVVR